MKHRLRLGYPCILVLLITLSTLFPLELSGLDSKVRFTAPSSPGEYEGPGVAAPLFWTGDGNRIDNPSFETGTYQPWAPIQSNALTTAAQIVQPGYEGASSLRLALVSGNFSNNNFWEAGEPVLYDSNADGIYETGEYTIKGPTPTLGSLLTHDPFIKFNDVDFNSTWGPAEPVVVDVDMNNAYSQNDIVLAGTPPALGASLVSDDKLVFVDQSADSFYSLSSDVTGQQVGFEVSLRLRAAMLVESMTGGTQSDRSEVSVSLTTSLGSVLTLHYIASPNSGMPSNSTSDAYYRTSSLTGQWVSMDRNVPVDAQQAFSSIFPSFNSVKEVRLSEFGRTQPFPTDDPKIKYVDANIDSFWEVGESLVYDANSNARFDTPGDQSISGPLPAPGASLKDDPRIKFVDSNGDNLWNTGSPGESIIYDKNSNGQWDQGVNNEVVMYGNTPSRGTLLQKPVHETTQSLFDRVELYSATGNYDWIRNGAFTSSLSAWTASGFTVLPSEFNQTSPSAKGTANNGVAELVQSVDGRPKVESWLNLKAAARIGAMTGGSRNDTVDILLGMIDSRGYAFSLYYVFRTGDLTLPTNDTDTIYIRTNGFGLFDQWITINRNLTQDTRDFSSLLGFIQPFRIELLALEVASNGFSATTTAYFDDISIYQPYKYGQATSYFYATSGADTTYVYTAASVPQGTFYLDIPRDQSVLNITSPEGVRLRASEYDIQVIQGGVRRISTQPSLTRDTKIKFVDSNSDQSWSVGEPVVYDANANSLYDNGDQNLTRTVGNGAILRDDLRIKFVDTNSTTSGGWDPGRPGEPIIYDKNGNDQWDPSLAFTGELVMYGAPIVTMFNHAPLANWTVYTTSTNSLRTLYAEDPVKKTQNTTLTIGSTANLVSRSIDPSGTPIAGASVNISLWDDATGALVISRTGVTNVQGWFNVTGVTPPPGTFTLEATSFSAYVGVADFHLSLKQILSVSLTLSTGQVPAGGTVTISGSVNPATAGIVVTIYSRLAGNIQKTQIATVTTDSNGSYSYAWTPSEGDYEITAAIGDSATASAESNSRVIFVGPPENQLPLILGIAGIIAAAGIVAIILFRRNSRGLTPSSTTTL